MKMHGWIGLLSLTSLFVACAPSGGSLNPPNNFVGLASPAPSISLSWNAVAGASGYVLERKSPDGNYSQISSQSTTTYTDPSLSFDTPFSYRLKATNGPISSPWVEQTLTTPTQSPINFAVAEATPTSLTLTWDPISGATGYRLERANGSNLSTWTLRPLSAGSLPNRYTDTDIQPAASYTYRLSALNAGGASQTVSLSFSNLAPGNFQAQSPANQSGSGRNINLSWEAASGATGYALQRRIGSGAFEDLAGASNLSTLSYTDSTVTTGTSYTYRIRALTDKGFGPWVESNSLTTSGTAVTPGAPTNLSATASSNPKQINLTWEAPTPNNATGYSIQRSTGNSGSFSSIGTSISTGFTDSTLEWGTAYSYRVVANNAAGNSPASNTATASTLAAPGAPTGFVGSPTSATSINLSWSAPTSGGTPSGYQIERRIYSSNDPGTILSINGTSYTNTVLTANTSYTFTLTALNPAGSSTPVSVVVSTPSNSPNPTGLFAKPLSTTAIRIVWQALSGATNYTVERSSDGSNFTQISTNPLTNLYFDDASVGGSGPYTYRVKAQINGQYGTGTTLAVPLTPPNAPSGIYALAQGEGNGSGGFTNRSWMSTRVGWNPSSGGGPVGYYELQRLGPSGSWERVFPETYSGADAEANPPSRDYEGHLPTTLFGDVGSQGAPLQAGVSYQYRVRAVSPFGSSGWSSTASATLPGASSPSVAGCKAGSSNQGSLGCFGAVFDWPHVATHGAVLSNGKVITFHSRDADGTASNPDFNNQSLHDHTLVTVWDPANGSFTRADNPNTDLFCAGFVSGADGRFYTTGGNLGSSKANGQGYYSGSRHTDIFDPISQTWSKGPDMTDGRWYPSTITLSDGRLLTIGGNGSGVPSVTSDRMANPIPEIWNTSSGTLTRLSGASTNSNFGGLGGFEHYYPWIHQAPNGMVFLSGSQMAMGYLDTSGSGSWVALSQRDNVWRSYGTSVMFRPGEVAVFGGGTPAKNSVTMMQLQSNNTTVVKRSANSMLVSRTHLNGTLMADGKVFINGGNTNGANYDPTPANADPQRQSEIWTPPTPGWATRSDDSSAANDGSFAKGPTAQIRRFYHSIALLLPDATILTAGSGACGGCTGLNQLNAEIYYPAYLFNADGSPATRPVITAIPGTVSYNSSFAMSTDQTSISRVTMLKLGSATHAFNMGQGFIELSFSAGTGGQINVNAPQSGNLAPPGHYMLFVFDPNGVPSVAKIIKVQ